MRASGSARLLGLALLAQLGGGLVAILAHALGLQAGPSLLLTAGVGAALVSVLLRMPGWWAWISLCFPPALGFGAGLDLPPSLPALLLLASLLLFGGVMASRVPLWLSGRRARSALCAELPALFPGRRDLDVVDLGGGLGGLLLALSRSGHCTRCCGIEWAPLPFALGWLRLRLHRFSGRWRFGSLWGHALGQHDLAYAFLSPAAMPRLWDKARAEMRPGSWLVSYRFEIPGAPPDRRVSVGSGADDALLMWRMPGPAARS